MPVCPAGAVTVILAGQVSVRTGVTPCVTVTLNEQLFVLPQPSVAVTYTVVVPIEKKEPLAGLVVTFTEPVVQVEVAVGAG